MNSTADASPIDPEHSHWRPLKPRQARRPPPINNPVLEPYWSGTRVLAHFLARPDSPEPAALELVDERGEPINDQVPEVVEALRRSVMALEAVIDGVLTSQPTMGGIGAVARPDVRPMGMSLFLPRKAELAYERIELPKPRDTDQTPLAFIAVDLLSVDGESLLELPLMERRRQLESLFVESELVRVSPLAQPPLRPWLNSWKSAGFRGLMIKAANSRYRPGEQTLEWAFIDRIRG